MDGRAAAVEEAGQGSERVGAAVVLGGDLRQRGREGEGGDTAQLCEVKGALSVGREVIYREGLRPWKCYHRRLESSEGWHTE